MHEDDGAHHVESQQYPRDGQRGAEDQRQPAEHLQRGHRGRGDAGQRDAHRLEELGRARDAHGRELLVAVHQEDHPDGDPGDKQNDGTRLIHHACSSCDVQI
ncbi:hypothetical protein GCM10027203_02760 [Nonomuraea fastidiosa]